MLGRIAAVGHWREHAPAVVLEPGLEQLHAVAVAAATFDLSLACCSADLGAVDAHGPC